ncbi:hypothetical protein BJY00DRAFT_320085 [Aspergillus carlsbadensis]|nr:hypothetical protein BJY00DRAFT_320085 [Aspergillus carlsbadensis]
MSNAQNNNGARPAADVGEILDRAAIPHLLFCWWAVDCYGKDKATQDIDFIIPDDKIPSAVTALEKSALEMARKPGTHKPDTPSHLPNALAFALVPVPNYAVHNKDAPNRFHPIAESHFHTRHACDYWLVISLHAHSKLLWWLPTLTLKWQDQETNRTITFTTDPRLPNQSRTGSTGSWTGLYPLRIPTLATLFEALVLLYCRDVAEPGNVALAWRDMLMYLTWQRSETSAGKSQRKSVEIVLLRRALKERYVRILDAFLDGRPRQDIWGVLNRFWGLRCDRGT